MYRENIVVNSALYSIVNIHQQNCTVYFTRMEIVKSSCKDQSHYNYKNK